MIAQTIIPDYIYPGQAFDELGSLVFNMPQTPRIAFDLWTLPGSRDAVNTAARAVFASNISPYGEE